MKIEKLEENPHFSSAHEAHTKKINEIVDLLEAQHGCNESHVDRIEKMEERLNNHLKRIQDLEQFQTPKSYNEDNDPLKQRHESAKEGTFEWALCLMKKGIVLCRGSKKYGRYFLRPKSTLDCLAFQVDGCDTQQWDPSSDAILASDWEIVK